MSNKLKVAYILSRFPYLTETFILREMIGLRKQGFDVHIFPLFSPLTGPIHRQVEEMMPYVHNSPLLFSFQVILSHFYFLFLSPIKYFRALYTAIWQTYREPRVLVRVFMIFCKALHFARQMKDLEVDHIHAHFVWVNGIAAKIISDLIGITFSYHPHAFGLFMRDQESVRRQLDQATGIVTVSQYHCQYIADLCQDWPSHEIKIVPYGLDLVEFTPNPQNTSTDIAHIISVGRLVKKKGHEYLIDACAILARAGYKFHTSIVGTGPLKDKLQTKIDEYQIQDYVSLLGVRNQSEIKELYRQSNLFVLACTVAENGDRDGMPNVLLEALAMQLPIITTPVTGIPEVICNEENGLLVPERDSQALARAIERLIEDKELSKRLAQKGRQSVAKYDINRTVGLLDQALLNIHASRTDTRDQGRPS